MGFIYIIKCLPAGKFYVGQAINVERRFKEHRLKLSTGKGVNRYLQSAWQKYGEAAFAFTIVEVVPEELLREREQWWIDNLGSSKDKGYNCQYPVKAHAPSKRMSLAHKDYWAKLSPEEKELRVAHLRLSSTQLKATASKQNKNFKEGQREIAKKQWQNPTYDSYREELRQRMKKFGGTKWRAFM